MQALPGFRDFLPDDCATRNYIFARWREIARRYGFVEWDGPVLEPTDLYRKKSGDEIVQQLFHFLDKSGRDVALRPELTPTLARVVASHPHQYKKPLRWFSIGQFFRYEKQQRGRSREHYQLNCDIIGEQSGAADAELLNLCVDILRAFGFGAADVVVRVSNRDAWTEFLLNRGIDESLAPRFLEIIDKFERTEISILQGQLAAFGLNIEDVTTFVENPYTESVRFAELLHELRARGLEDFVLVDPLIVRGLAYYTGFVFEVFDRQKRFRAIAGGGRYNRLVRHLSDGEVDYPAVGFAMGDVVLSNLMATLPLPSRRLRAAKRHKLDAYVILAEQSLRWDAIKFVQRLRDHKWTVAMSLEPQKIGRQFERAAYLSARYAIVVGSEWPLVTVKNLKRGDQIQISSAQAIAGFKHKLAAWRTSQRRSEVRKQ